MDLQVNKLIDFALLEQIPVGIFCTDTQGLCLFVNKKWCEITGLTVETAKGNGWANALHIFDRDYIAASWNTTIKLGLPFKMEFCYQHTDGKIVWVYSQASPVLTKDGQIKGYIGTVTDITHLKSVAKNTETNINLIKLAEQKLKETKEYFELGLESAEIGVWSWDIVNNSLLWDKRIYQLFDVPTTKVVLEFDDFFNRLHPDDRAHIQNEINKTISNTINSYNTEFRVVSANQQIRYLKTHGRAYFDQKNNPIFMIGMCWDITAQKNTEHRMRQQQNELMDIARQSAVGEMASCLAHELTQPLTAIATYAQLCVKQLAAEGTTNAALLTNMQHIVKQSERAGNIIHRIKNFARQNSHYYQPTNIYQLINETIELLDYEKTGKLPELLLELANDLPTVHLEHTQIQQVIINLIKNSIEAFHDNHKPTVKQQIKIQAYLEDNKLAILIADNGPGIPGPLQARIFEPYFTTKKTGIGIGLAICRSITEAHGGQLILLGSSENKGTCFKFTLPLQ